MNHLRHAGRPFEEQSKALREIVSTEPVLMTVLAHARDMRLADHWLVSGAVYNSVWNALTGRAPLTGVKDIDLFYFDDGDLSYEAEDVVIRAGATRFAGLPVPVEIRNQARVHLWYEGHFGVPYPPLASSGEAIRRFASLTHAVGVRLGDEDGLEIYAPYGLDPIFSFRLVPNRLMDNRRTHEEKAKRQCAVWPELTVEPW